MSRAMFRLLSACVLWGLGFEGKGQSTASGFGGDDLSAGLTYAA